ncbi:hypothetical protein IT779_12585 [Nocardia sp. NEAU-351]|uniref:DUF4383 domain-containing protein n=2 Tax=Nocardia bovistercoris TaxID=2785916 RepID=A0A931I936_9NOCA|nr:hypothetical protein [Nocardia bovistercoris]
MRLDQHRRRWLAVRIILGILAFQGIAIGLWAVFAPHSWYTSFPGLFGMHWVGLDGPFNHHLAADVGAFFLALGAVSLFALFQGGGATAQAAGVGWSVMALPHLIYHLGHRPAEMGTASFVLSLIAAAALLVLGIALLIVTPRGPRVADPDPLEFRFPRRKISR